MPALHRGDAKDLKRLRTSEFPEIERYAYFNHASDSPLPARAAAAIDERVRLLQNPLLQVKPREQYLDEAQRRLGSMLNVPPRQIAFLTNVADATASVANGLPWQSGDEVVLVAGEFATFVYPWRNLDTRGVECAFVPRHGASVDLADVEAAITEHTRVVAVSHVEFQTGYQINLAALGEICRQKNVLLVIDASQSLGALPLDAAACHAAAVVSVGYKWLMSPHGISVLYVSEEAQERIRPSAPGRYSVAAGWQTADYALEWQPDAWRYQGGALNWIGVAALAESLSLLEEVGYESVAAHARRNADRIVEELTHLPVEITSSLDELDRSQIISFTRGSIEADDRFVADAMEAGVVTGRRGYGVRIGSHFWNQDHDIDRLLDVVTAMTR